MNLKMVFKNILLLPFSVIFAQSTSTNTHVEKVANGQLIFTSIHPKIIKVSFVPNNYKKADYI
ncbi:MAG: hypothetical protein ACOVNY_11075, partial [Chitinophagaceae bacterium]